MCDGRTFTLPQARFTLIFKSRFCHACIGIHPHFYDYATASTAFLLFVLGVATIASTVGASAHTSLD